MLIPQPQTRNPRRPQCRIARTSKATHKILDKKDKEIACNGLRQLNLRQLQLLYLRALQLLKRLIKGIKYKLYQSQNQVKAAHRHLAHLRALDLLDNKAIHHQTQGHRARINRAAVVQKSGMKRRGDIATSINLVDSVELFIVCR